MPRKDCEAVPEGNCSLPQQEEFVSGEPTLADIYRLCEERFDRMDSYSDRWNRKLDEISDETRVMDQHVTSQEHGARQPRLTMEVDGHANTKTQERTEGAGKAGQAMRGDSCTAEQKVPDGPKTSITFGVEAEPFDLPCREDVLVEDGATAPKSCLPSLEMRTTTAVGDLGKTSTVTETNFNQPPLRFCATEETDLEANCKKTSTPYVSYDSSAVQDSNLFTAPYCRRVVETKSRQNGRFIQAVRKVTSAPAHFWDRGARWFVVRLYRVGQLVTSFSDLSEEIRWLSETRLALIPCKQTSSRLEWLEVMSRRNRGHIIEGDSR